MDLCTLISNASITGSDALRRSPLGEAHAEGYTHPTELCTSRKSVRANGYSPLPCDGVVYVRPLIDGKGIDDLMKLLFDFVPAIGGGGGI